MSFSTATAAISSSSFREYTEPVGLPGELSIRAFVLEVMLSFS